MTSSPSTSTALQCPVTGVRTDRPTGPAGCPVSPRATAFDPFSDGYQQDPADYTRWARDEEPVFWSPELGYWIVTRYEDVRAVFRDPGFPGNPLTAEQHLDRFRDCLKYAELPIAESQAASLQSSIQNLEEEQDIRNLLPQLISAAAGAPASDEMSSPVTLIS